MITVPMTRQQFEAKAADLLAKQGINLAGNKGQVSKSGVSVEYDYDGAELTLQVTHKPMLVTLEYCESQIREWLG